MNRNPYSPERNLVRAVLKQMRAEAGMTQRELAAKLKELPNFVTRYEKGERRLDLPELAEICRALGYTLDDLIERYGRAG